MTRGGLIKSAGPEGNLHEGMRLNTSTKIMNHSTDTTMVVAVLAMVMLSACDSLNSDAAPPPLPRPVKLIVVDGMHKDVSRSYPATIEAADRTELSFQVGGRIQELPVVEGDEVKAGTLIAQLDQRDYRNQVASAKAQFDNAEDEYRRSLRLSDTNVISQSELELRKSQRDIAKAQLDIAEKALSDTTITAPFDGQVASLNFRRLQSINPGDTFATFISSRYLEAVIHLPSSAIAGIPREAGERRDDSPVHVVLETLPELRFEAMFKEAQAIADSTSQTYEVAFLFERPTDVLMLPGMNATVEIERFPVRAGTGASGTRVPLTAIVSDGARQFVWVYDEKSQTVSRRAIETAEGIGESLLVTNGLNAGETIVAAGTSYLFEGMQVRPWTD